MVVVVLLLLRSNDGVCRLAKTPKPHKILRLPKPTDLILSLSYPLLVVFAFVFAFISTPPYSRAWTLMPLPLFLLLLLLLLPLLLLLLLLL